MDFETLPDEIKALVTIQRHIAIVQKYLTRLSNRLAERAIEHDLSKLSKDEFAGFVELNQARGKAEYGSPEYLALVQNNKTVDLHISRNSHHPGYHSDGIEGMSFLDLIEWVIDIKAGEVYGTSAIEVFEKKRDKLGLDDKMMWLISLIIEELK